MATDNQPALDLDTLLAILDDGSMDADLKAVHIVDSLRPLVERCKRAEEALGNSMQTNWNNALIHQQQIADLNRQHDVLRERCKRAEAACDSFATQQKTLLHHKEILVGKLDCAEKANEVRLAEAEQVADLTRQRDELCTALRFVEDFSRRIDQPSLTQQVRIALKSVEGGTDGT